MTNKTFLYVNSQLTPYKKNDIEYRYEQFSILLPHDHQLPHYQKAHPKYDRFLPHLSKYLIPGETIIDVGANVGDSLAGMLEKNSNLNYVCIEPDDKFFSYLEINIGRMKVIKKSASIQLINSLVGEHIKMASLEGNGGSKHVIINPTGNYESQTLDSLLTEINSSKICLIKSDVDGYDWDVLNSGKQLIKDHQPILFFECQLDSANQKENYEKTIAWLKEHHYNDWVVFDNFGEYLIRTENICDIYQLINYVWQQNCQRTTRTIYYYDILAATKKDSYLLDLLLPEYRSK